MDAPAPRARRAAPARRRRAAARQAARASRRTPRCSARSALYRAEKAGHTGTLDPLASGLLPLCFGEATKFAQALLDARQGLRRDGALRRRRRRPATPKARSSRRAPVDVRRAPTLEAALPRFVGTHRADAAALLGAQVRGPQRTTSTRARASRSRARRATVEIHALELVDWTPPDAVLASRCSKGTYIRVLAEDIGAALGCGAHLAALRRTATGGFGSSDAVTLEALEAMTDAARDALLLPADALLARPAARSTLDARRRAPVPAGAGAAGARPCRRRVCACSPAARCSGVADVVGGRSRSRAGWSRRAAARERARRG